MSERMFPILGVSYDYQKRVNEVRQDGGFAIVVQVPWGLLAPHEQQAQRNHSQTLKRLAERGGLSPCEAVAIIEDRRWSSMISAHANQRLIELVLAYQAKAQEPRP